MGRRSAITLWAPAASFALGCLWLLGPWILNAAWVFGDGHYAVGLSGGRAYAIRIREGCGFVFLPRDLACNATPEPLAGPLADRGPPEGAVGDFSIYYTPARAPQGPPGAHGAAVWDNSVPMTRTWRPTLTHPANVDYWRLDVPLLWFAALAATPAGLTRLRAARRRRWRRCAGCGYPRQGLVPGAACPECGRPC